MTLRSNIPSYIGKNVVFMFSFALISYMINLSKYLYIPTTLDNKFTKQKRPSINSEWTFPPFISIYFTDVYLPKLWSVCFKSLWTEIFTREERSIYKEKHVLTENRSKDLSQRDIISNRSPQSLSNTRKINIATPLLH